MFYSGGARKKQAIREIFKFKSEEPEPEPASESDSDLTSASDSESSEDDKDSRSRRSSRSDSDSSDDTEGLSNPDKNDYIITLGSNDTSSSHHRYSFVDEELTYDIEEFADTHPEINKFQLVIYKINTRSSSPFLEFLFYYDKSSKDSCQLPYYHHKPKQNVRKETDRIMGKLFTGKYRFKGFFHDEQTDQCFIFYEKYFVNEAKTEKSAFVSLQHSNHWLWICTTEIIYNKKYLTIPIDTNAVDFFIAYPMIGILQATIVSSYVHTSKRFHSLHIEAPTVLYYGSDICYAKNTAVYGLKREPITSRYGPFYYFTTFEHSFFWGCYLKSKDKTKKRETSNGGISRYAVFTKKMKTAFVDDDYDKELVKKYTDRKNVFETKMNTFRQTQDDYQLHNTYNSIYGYDYDWTIEYDTIYNGYYAKTKKDILRPIWCVCDHRNFQLLSYYEINVDKCPEHYDSEFLEYSIL
jgi:hypothetical protein